MTKTGLAFLLSGIVMAAVVALLVSAQQQTQPPPSQQVYKSGWKRWSTDHPPTLQELEALLLADEYSTPPPTGIALAKDYGTIEGYLTSLVHPTNGRRCLVTIVANNADLTAAYIFVDGALNATATVANGKIVDLGNGLSEATLSFWVPLSPPYQVKARWEDSATTTFVEQAVTLGL